MTHPAIFSQFSLQRVYPQSRQQVFAALSDSTKKRRWFAEGPGFEVQSYSLDFTVGGFERSRFTFGTGPAMTNDCVYTDIVAQERIVFTYWMTIGGEPLSSSHCAIELSDVPGGTKFAFTEHTVYLNGEDGTASRREGTQELLESLARELREHS